MTEETLSEPESSTELDPPVVEPVYDNEPALPAGYIPYNSVTDLVWADEAATAINCIVVFPSVMDGQPIPYTAGASDPGWPHSEEIFARAVAGDFGPIAPFIPPSLEAVKADLCRQVDAMRDERIAAGFEFSGIRFQSGSEDRENIAGASTAALGAMMAGAQAGNLRWAEPDADFEWIAEDNSLVPMDAQTTFALGQAAMAHKQRMIFEARQTKNAIMAADDEAGARAAAEMGDDGHD